MMRSPSQLLAAALALSAQLCFAQADRSGAVDCDNGLSAWCAVLPVLEGNTGNRSMLEIFQLAIMNNNKPNSTLYGNQDNVICFDNDLSVDVPFIGNFKIGGLFKGGICVFPENLEGNATISLERVKELTDIIIRSSCETCGKIAIDYPKSTNTSGSILKFDYRTDTSCFDGCIANSDLTTGSPTTLATATTLPTTTASGTGDSENTAMGFSKGVASASIAAFVMLFVSVLAFAL